MKQYLILSIILLSTITKSTLLVAQDRKDDYKIENRLSPIELRASEDGGCFLVFGGNGKIVLNMVKVGVMKFNVDLKPAWKSPIIFKSLSGNYEVGVFSYSNPSENIAVDYVVKNETFLQVLADGTAKEIKTSISKKETNNLAAAFTDANGLNIITLAGDDDYPSGSMNWYTFAHKDLLEQKRRITIPLPPDVDSNNASDWRLSEVTASGLFFYYVSYKNNAKDNSRPILSTHVVRVDSEGKTGKLLNLDLGLKRYVIAPVDYKLNELREGRVFEPKIWTMDPRTSGIIYTPNDNAYAGIKIDAAQNRIYAVAGLSEKMDKKEVSAGPKSMNGFGWAFPITSLELSVFDLEGDMLYKVNLDRPPSKLAASDDYSYRANEISINPLPNKEGLICKFLNNGKGTIWAINSEGKMQQQVEFQPYSYKFQTARIYQDIFSANYSSMKEFENSPYLEKEKSSPSRFFEKCSKKDKENVYFLSQKNSDILAIWLPKERVIKLNGFVKFEGL